ncbi:MAG: 4'-phosphopantetheinyl transferase superfamily protein [Clostridiaceae bacterium]|jgi:phosphopantetheinyl transferase|nr:4'-phosphopantetheinyl transferase superfamily protein [Clostridiaceae bacterium]
MSTAFKISSFLETNSRVHEFEYEVMDMRRVGEKDINLLSVLSEEEIRQLDSLKIEKNRIQWIAGRYAVKSALFKYKLQRAVLMDLSCIDVLKGEDSSPFIPQYQDICVSITHSFPYCIAIVSNKKIGVDLEGISEPNESLIRYFYSTEEKNILENLKKTDEYCQRAMIFWTRKEAVSKLLKLGMRMDFRELNTSKNEMTIGNYYIYLKSYICGEFALSIASE